MRQFKLFSALFAVVIFGSLLWVPQILAQHGPTNAAQLSAKKLQVAPGLSVELFAGEPLLQNPVAFSIDERGRFFISETHRYKDSIFDITRETNWLLNDLSFRKVEDRAAFLQKPFATNLNFLTKDSELIRLVEDRDGDGRAETSSVFADGFNQNVSGTAAGILARHGEVWFTCIPDLWKFTIGDLRLTNQTPRLDETGFANRKSKIVNRKLATGFGVHIGVSGHDLHGLVMGPDGKIYFSSGDRGFSVHTKEGRFLNSPDTGGVLRCNPDGSDLELFCTGLRNPQGLAFDQYGNLFTDDNDTAGEDKSRVLYLVEGGDYGWRASYQFMEDYGPWVRENNWLGGIDGTLPHSGEVAQGPSGLAFYPGTGLPEKYQNHFLVCDFPKGVWSFAIKPKGASYEVIEKEKFLWNLGATDVKFGPDGATYVSDWGQSYSMPEGGKIFRVFDPAQKENPALVEVKKLLADGMGKRSVDELINLFGHADMRVRMEAQFELVNRAMLSIKQGGFPARSTQEIDSLFRTATSEKRASARLHAIWGLGQIGAKYPAALETFLPLLGKNDPETLAQLARAMGNWDTRWPIRSFSRFLEHASPRVQFFAAMTLGKWKNSEAISPLLKMLRKNADVDPYLVHAGVWALVKIGDFEAIQAAAKNENVSIRRAALLSMRRMARPEISQFLNDAVPRLVIEAARAINDVPINDAMQELAAKVGQASRLPRTGETPVLLSRAINANFRLGQNSNAVALANFAANTDALESMRVEALDALSDWENPSQLDRVMGLWRPLPKREIAVAQNAFHSVANELFKTDSEKVLLAAIRCARKLKSNESALVEIFKTSRSASVREEILQALADFKSSALAQAVEMALADDSLELRREGIKSVGLLHPEKSPALLEKLLATETNLSIRQTVFATLGNLTNNAATEVLNRQLDLLLAGKIPPELHLDLLNAAGKASARRIVEKLNRYKTCFPKNDSLAEFRVALVGGNAERGAKIFYQREDVACLRCHAIKGVGGNVGPALGGSATRQSREYFLESIVEPNKQIAPGFENIVVTLRNGTAAAGVVKSEDKNELVLNSPEDGIVKIKKEEIAKRERGLSSMPEGMGTLLTKFELRDLIEYLSALK